MKTKITSSKNWSTRSALGATLKVIRIVNRETSVEMAEKLKLKLHELSAIENGNIKIPDDFLDKLFSAYKFSDKSKRILIKHVNLLKEGAKENVRV